MTKSIGEDGPLSRRRPLLYKFAAATGPQPGPDAKANEAPALYTNRAGRCIKRTGPVYSDKCIIELLTLAGNECTPDLPIREFYAVATLAQGVLEVSQGVQPSFSRSFTCQPCPIRGEAPRCVVRAVAYFFEGTFAGAKISCAPEKKINLVVD